MLVPRRPRARRGEPSTISAARRPASFSENSASAAHGHCRARRRAGAMRRAARKATRSRAAGSHHVVSRVGARLRSWWRPRRSRPPCVVSRAPDARASRATIARRASAGDARRRRRPTQLCCLRCPTCGDFRSGKLRTRVLGVADSVANFGFMRRRALHHIRYLSVFEGLRSARTSLRSCYAAPAPAAPMEPKLEVRRRSIYAGVYILPSVARRRAPASGTRRSCGRT